jgi:YYY domain-containing protein
MEFGLVAVWLVTYLALGAAGLPVAAALARRLPDRGAGVALPLSLAVLTLAALWVGTWRFGTVALAAGLVVLLALSVAATRFGDADPDWDVAGETALVFAVAFLFLVAVRAVDPAIHPLLGEKFMDFGYLRAVLRADTLPPEDMWFAGEPVAYYYGGHLASGLLAMLTGTEARFAYNLALAGFYGMLVTAAYGLGGAVASNRGASRRHGAVFAAFFVGLASNLYTPARMLALAALELLPASVRSALLSDPAATLEELRGFVYWNASRVIPLTGDGTGTVNEFPLFGWLNGDLHGHMTSTPFTLLVVALLFAYFLTPADERTRRRLLVFGAVPPVGGLLAAVNTWSFPSVLGLTALALLFAPAHPAGLLPGRLASAVRGRLPDAETAPVAAEGCRLALATGLAVAVELLAAAWALPFLLGSASTRGVGLFPDRSTLAGLLVVHGAFVVLTGAYFWFRGAPDGDRRSRLAAGLLAGVVVAAVAGVPALGLFVPFVAGAWYLARSDADVGFEAVLVAAAAGLALAVEFVYVVENAGPGRFNTVFKLYAQVWNFWAVAAGGVTAVLLSERWGTASLPGNLTVSRDGAVRVAVAVLVVSTSIYGALALSNHFAGESPYARYPANDDPTLDGLAHLEEAYPGQAAAIRWLDDREGRPVLVTAAPAWYDEERYPAFPGEAPAASLTGLPTVAGWNHAADFHGQAAYEQRVADVETIYTGAPAEQAALLRQYDVTYVYVGPDERGGYENITVGAVPGVEPVQRLGDVTIYRVNESELPE